MTAARTIIYIRVSTEEQAQGHSLDAQKKICTAFAEQRGWTVVAVYDDPGASGKTDRRKGFQRMLADARAGRADVVLTHKLDRFSRSIVHILTYLREFNKLGIAYVSATEQFDFTTPMGKVVLAILAAFAEWYLDNLSQETMKGKRARAEKGLWNGDPPFGYRINPETEALDVVPAEAEAVRLAFTEYATGIYTDLQIARLLNAKGYRTSAKRGPSPFSKDTVRQMLTNTFYLGLVKYKRETFAGRHAAIIGRDLFDECMQARRRHTLRKNTANHATRVYPLAGIAYCRECGRKLRGQYWGRRGRHYHDPAHEHDDPCSQEPNIPAEPIEEDVAQIFSQIRLPDRWQERIIARLKSRRDPRKDERRRERLRSQLARAKHLFITGDLTEREYGLEKTRIQSELDSLKPVLELDLIRTGEMLADFGRLWAEANDEQKKRLFQAALERVYVLGTQITAIQPRPEFYALLTACGPDGHSLRIQLRGQPRTVALLQFPLPRPELAPLPS